MVTIDDVARDAGVSTSTVSYVLSGKRAISAETSARVARSIESLGYHPNAKARALASKRTNALALVVPLRPDNNVPVVMQFVSAVATAARDSDYDVLLVTGAEGAAGIRRVSRSALVDAVIVMDVEDDDPRLPLLRGFDLPSVLIGHPAEPGGLASVDLDFRQAATVCVDHLADLGHRTITLIGSAPAVYDRRSSYAVAFADGFASATARRGIEARWCPTEPSYEQASALVRREFEERPGTTALVVHNEAVLGAVLSGVRRLGLRVPEDISVVALCPEDIALNQSVELTGVAVPADEIGRIAVEMVLRRLAGANSAETRLLAPRLTVRSSTAAPPQ